MLINHIFCKKFDTNKPQSMKITCTRKLYLLVQTKCSIMRTQRILRTDYLYTKSLLRDLNKIIIILQNKLPDIPENKEVLNELEPLIHKSLKRKPKNITGRIRKTYVSKINSDSNVIESFE